MLAALVFGSGWLRPVAVKSRPHRKYGRPWSKRSKAVIEGASFGHQMVAHQHAFSKNTSRRVGMFKGGQDRKRP
ncbi:hypothetical protein [Aquabacterium sp.]|uniref:hypothetical protein n=1 Tax=Aquabacterium sp. TaxID=1872578 RepID=UPI003BB03F26